MSVSGSIADGGASVMNCLLPGWRRLPSGPSPSRVSGGVLSVAVRVPEPRIHNTLLQIRLCKAPLSHSRPIRPTRRREFGFALPPNNPGVRSPHNGLVFRDQRQAVFEQRTCRLRSVQKSTAPETPIHVAMNEFRIPRKSWRCHGAVHDREGLQVRVCDKGQSQRRNATVQPAVVSS